MYEPFSQNEQNGLGPASGDPTWAFAIAQADSRAVSACDAVFAVVNGVPPDEGVCVELGVAIATRTPYFLFRDDFRNAGDSAAFPCNLMLLAGLPVDRWQEYVYGALADIGSPEKALAKWVQQQQQQQQAPALPPAVARATPALQQRASVRAPAAPMFQRLAGRALPRKRLTLVFCLRGLSLPSRLLPTHVLLGMKKRGFGAGKWNGFGGKVEKNGETILEGAVRELREEAGVVATDMTRRGMLEFEMLPKDDADRTAGDKMLARGGVSTVLEVHVFTATKWKGEPAESEEMRPKWFPVADVPLDNMWTDDVHWLPTLLAQPAATQGDAACFRGYFRFAPDQSTILAQSVDWEIEAASLPDPTQAGAT